MHDQSDKKLSAIESVLRFVCLVIFTTGINFEGVSSFEQRKRLTACDKERSIIRLVSNRKDLDRVNRSLFAPLLTPDFDLLDAIFEADLNGLYNKDYDLTLASIYNSDMTRFLNHEYQPCIFLEKDCIVICGVLYVVFEREAREFSSFHTCMFQLRQKLYHSHRSLIPTRKKSLGKVNAQIQTRL